MKKQLVLLTVLLLTLYIPVNAQQNYKAKFINAFTRYMNWPDEAKQGFFNIGVYGSFDLYKEVSQETMGKTVGHQNVVAINILKENQLRLTNLHILVIGKKYCTGDALDNIVKQFAGTYTLIITEEDGIVHGAGISFKSSGSALGFRYNSSNIRSKGIAMSRQFEGMGENAN